MICILCVPHSTISAEAPFQITVNDTLVAEEPKYCIHSLKHYRLEGQNVMLTVLGCKTLPENSIVVTLGYSCNMYLFNGYDMAVQDVGCWFQGAQPYLPEPKELCLVKDNSNKWYRAVFVKHRQNNKCFVYAIDYGVFFTAQLDDVRVSIKKINLEYESETNYCLYYFSGIRRSIVS